MGEFFQIQVRRQEAVAENRHQLHSSSAQEPHPSSFAALPLPAQDDYLDLFGDPSVTGKIGTDIQDNKCSWLVVQCLQRATPEQYQILKVPERGWWVPELVERDRAVVLNWRQFSSQGDIWQCQQTFFAIVITTLCVCMWYRHLVGRSQRCCQTCSTQNSSPSQDYLVPNFNSAKVEKPWSRGCLV